MCVLLGACLRWGVKDHFHFAGGLGGPGASRRLVGFARPASCHFVVRPGPGAHSSVFVTSKSKSKSNADAGVGIGMLKGDSTKNDRKGH